MLSQHLIERALSLTEKTKYCVSRIDFDNMDELWEPFANFDWHQFCYYLLSPEFIEKYSENLNAYHKSWYKKPLYTHTTKVIWKAIYEYQSWDEKPLVKLLSKI